METRSIRLCHDNQLKAGVLIYRKDRQSRLLFNNNTVSAVAAFPVDGIIKIRMEMHYQNVPCRGKPHQPDGDHIAERAGRHET